MSVSAAVLEQLRHETNYEAPAWFENAGQAFWLDDLSPEQQVLFARFEPVAMQEYDLETFGLAAINFMLFFQEGLGEHYREKPAFQRFAILYPDFVDSLQDRLAVHSGNFAGLDGFSQQMVFRAYELMSTLVDEKDPYVKDVNGRVDTAYLTR